MQALSTASTPTTHHTHIIAHITMLVLRCFQSIVLARALFGFALAEKLPVERHQPTDCFYTCTYLGDLTWGDIPANTTYFAKFGTSKLFIDSFEYCLETFCSNQAGADQGWTSYQNTAALSGIDMPSRSQVQENLPPDPSVADIWTNRLTIYNETIVPSVFAYQKYFRTLVGPSDMQIADIRRIP